MKGGWGKEAYILEIIKLMGYVDSKADPPTRTVTTHQNKTNSAILQTASHKPQENITKVKKTNKGSRNRKDKRKTARKRDARTAPR